MASQKVIKQELKSILERAKKVLSTREIWRMMADLAGYHHIRIALEEMERDGICSSSKLNKAKYWSIH